MYNLKTKYEYYYCKWNFDTKSWECINTFTGKEELVIFIANSSFLSDNGELHCSLYEDLNFSGWDIGNYAKYMRDRVDCEDSESTDAFYFRSRAFIDSSSKIVDVRDFEWEVKYYIEKGFWWRRKYDSLKPPYVYRCDPVPNLTKRWHIRLRKWKTWHRTLKQDAIPEYQEFVRSKARQLDKWEIDPFEHVEKSWKHQSKRRRQWEKRLPKHIDTVVPTKYEYLKESDDLMVN
jgi:hypothetical protein